MRHLENKLTSLVRAVVEPMGYELVGVEHFQRGKTTSVLRVYIDHIEGDLVTGDQDRVRTRGTRWQLARVAGRRRRAWRWS